MSNETSSYSKRRAAPRGLSHHGLPKTPAPLSPDGSIKSYRFSGASPPLSPRSFLALFRSEDSPRSHISSFSTVREISPSTTPQFPPVAQFEAGIKEDSYTHAHTCPTCGAGKKVVPQRVAPAEKENVHPDHDPSSTAPLSRLAHRIKSALSTKRKEDILDQRKRQPKQVLQKVEPTHWTEM